MELEYHDPMSQKMSSKYMTLVETKLLMRDVFPLARNLGLSEAQIDAIKHDYPNDLKEQVHQVLSLWLRLNGEMANLGMFFKALENTGLRSVTDELKTFANIQESFV